MKQKRIFTLLMLLLYGISTCSIYGEEVVNMQHIGNHNDHSEYYPPADMPEVYFDSGEMEIIIEADGFASYYIVEIISMVTSQSMVYTQIGGYGDNIDVSLFPPGYYRLEITSSNNNEYEGYFTVE